MEFPDIKDVGVVAGFERWGCPYHGLSTAGVIAGSGKEISQPLDGSTYVLRVPGIAPLELTPEQIAADAANNFEWLDYVVLAGSGQQVYGGHNLGPLGWVYASADGSRWWIKLTSSANITGNSQTFTFSVKRFGEFMPVDEVVAETYTQTVTLSDIGQSTPTVTWHSGIETGTGIYDYTVNTYDLYLEDTSPDGSVAVLGLQNKDAAHLLNWTPNWFAGEPASMGFLSVTVSDGTSGPDIAVAVLHNRAEALGTYEYHPVDPDAGRRIVSNRLIAVWFDGDVPFPVKLSIDVEADNDWAKFPDVECPYDVTLNASSSGSYTFTLDWSSKSAAFVAAASASQTSHTVCVEGGSGLQDGSGSFSFDFEDGLLTGGGSYTLTGGSSDARTHLWAGCAFWWDNYLHSVDPPQTYHAGFLLAADVYLATGTPTPTGQKACVCLKRMNNKHFGFLGMKFDTLETVIIDDGGGLYHWDQSNDMVWLGGFSPAGKDALQGDLGVHSNIVPAGAVHPSTGIPVLRSDGTAICYV